MELIKTIQVLEKNKVSTSLKILRFYYVADTPDFLLKALTKPTSSIVRCTKEIIQTPLKIDFSLNLSRSIRREIINQLVIRQV